MIRKNLSADSIRGVERRPARRFALGSLAALLCALCPALLPAQAPVQTILVRNNDVWKYFKGTEDPPADWNKLEFDDTLWLQGPAPIGYGDVTTGTVLTDMVNNYLTVYCRRKFTLPELARVSSMILNVQYDDGFIAYINGKEITRQSMPAGAVNRNTPGIDHEFNSTVFSGNILPVSQDVLFPGENVLAIEVHNVSLGSSDLVLIPLLTGFILPEQKPMFIRGAECDNAPAFDIGDPIYLLRWRLQGVYTEPGCIDACDVDDSGVIDVTDAVVALQFLFTGGIAPPAPYPAKGPDPTDSDPLTCVSGKP